MERPGNHPVAMARRLAGWSAWLAILLAVAAGGRALARGPLAPPPLGDPGSWASWAAARSPVEAAFAVLALVVVVLAWYLLMVTSLGALARLWGARRLVRVVDVLTLPVVRRSLHAAAGVTLVGSTVAGVAGARVEPPLVTIAAVAGDEAGADDDEDPPVMRALPEDAPTGEGGPALAPGPTGEPPAVPTSQGTGTAGAGWEVRAGDHLWSLAERALGQAAGAGDATGPPPGEAEVARYWLRLIEANTDRLADPTNPDLIFPGQVLVLPPVGDGGEAATG
ncbi:MAG TPA: hypothetical protein VNT56_09495 [Acidimicrobiales bacterium]|nr:hypothetical protein [Acidimicrobiales bacterium]